MAQGPGAGRWLGTKAPNRDAFIQYQMWDTITGSGGSGVRKGDRPLPSWSHILVEGTQTVITVVERQQQGD